MSRPFCSVLLAVPLITICIRIGFEPITARSQAQILQGPQSWTHLDTHSEAVEQFLAMLKFEQKHQEERQLNSLKPHAILNIGLMFLFLTVSALISVLIETML